MYIKKKTKNKNRTKNELWPRLEAKSEFCFVVVEKVTSYICNSVSWICCSCVSYMTQSPTLIFFKMVLLASSLLRSQVLIHSIVSFLVSIDEEAVDVTRDDMRTSSEEIQNLILSKLKEAIADKLTRTMLNFRETYLGTLQRCVLLIFHCEDESFRHMSITYIFFYSHLYVAIVCLQMSWFFGEELSAYNSGNK